MQNVAEIFARNFDLHGELGASLSVWRGEEEIVSLHGGARTRDEIATWNEDTLVPVWSATKGPAALAFLLMLHDAGLDLTTPVQHVWPELRAAMTFGQMLSHQGGLAALDPPAPPVLDHAAVAAALARQEPEQAPGAAHSYHPRTFGFLVEECTRRLTGGQSCGAVLQERIAGPLGAEFWIGLPPEQHHRVARLYPGRPRADAGEEADFFAAFGKPGTLTRRAFSSPAGLQAVADLNESAAWAAGLAAMGGVGSARGLGKIYALLANGGTWQVRRLVPEPVLAWLGTPLCQGRDGVLMVPAAFSAGCMMDPLDAAGRKIAARMGPGRRAFGHPGAGGSLAFADPERGLAFAYTMNQMEPGVMPGSKAAALVSAVFSP